MVDIDLCIGLEFTIKLDEASNDIYNAQYGMSCTVVQINIVLSWRLEQ